jgi:hypothetical protein
VEYVVEVLELTPESYNQVLQANQLSSQNQIIIKSQSFSYGSAGIAPSTGAGTLDINFTTRASSLKGIIWSVSPSDAQDKNYAGVNPNLDNWSFICNGQAYPQRPIQCKYPAEAFLQNIKTWGSSYGHRSGSSRNTEFAVASTAYGTPNFYKAYAANAAGGFSANLATKANKFYQAIDLEKINGDDSSYTGISTAGSSSYIRLNIASALPAVVHTLQYFAYFDVLVIFDLATGQVMVSSA